MTQSDAIASKSRLFSSLESARVWLLSDYLRKWVLFGLLIGVAAGIGAIVFYTAIDFATQVFLGKLVGYEPPIPRGEGEVKEVSDMARPWLLPIVVGLGGLISGLVCYTLAPEAAGDDSAVYAFHHRAGRIRSRVPFIKLISASVVIGSGGSAGREGPAAQIASGFGVWLSDAFHLTAADRRIALAVGIGAGIGAIFKAPLGGALLAAEMLYLRDFELEALIPGFIASVIGYSIYASWTNWDPVFGTALGFQFHHPEQLIGYAVLGLACGLVGIAYGRSFHGTERFFERLAIPPHLKPAIGGVIVGTIAIFVPEVLSMGYGWLQFAIEGNTTELAARTMIILVALKIVATSLTVGSGGSGGIFAPGLFIGGMLGAAAWALLHNHVPWLPNHPEPFVVVGMGALFGGIAKAPMAVMLMVAEMTGEFTMIVPAMIAVSISYLVTGNNTIYEAQVPTRADSPAHRGEFTIPLIQSVTVGQAMRDAIVVDPAKTLAEAIALTQGDRQQVIAVVEQQRLVGAVWASEFLQAGDDERPVREVMRRVNLVTYPAESLHTALQRMIRASVEGLLVVEREHPERLAGFISLSELARVLDLQINDLARRPERAHDLSNDPLRFITVEEAMSKDFRVVQSGTPIPEVAELMAANGDHAAIVVDESGALTGIVTVTDLRRATIDSPNGDPHQTPDSHQTIEEIATRDVIVARAGQFLSNALAQPDAESARQLPVVEERGGVLTPVGLLRRSDVLVAYLRGREQRAYANLKQTRESAQDEVIMAEATVERESQANGLTLAELGLPAGVIVTVIERDGSLVVPIGQTLLLAGDHVRLLGTRQLLSPALAMLDAPDVMRPETGAQRATHH
jgi:CIC family chloride channel protein